MGLGKRKTTNIIPKLKFDGRIGKFYLSDRVLENGEWQTEQKNIEHDDFRAVFDLDNLQIGWINFPTGSGPDVKLVRAEHDYGDKPTAKHKEGIRLLVQMDDQLSGDVRELMSTANGLWNAIDTLHDGYLADRDKYPGKLPIVVVSGMLETGSGTSKSYEPVFTISEWVPRPASLPLEGIPVSETKKKPAVAAASPKAKDPNDQIPF
jgi:hypothetical protein